MDTKRYFPVRSSVKDSKPEDRIGIAFNSNSGKRYQITDYISSGGQADLYKIQSVDSSVLSGVPSKPAGTARMDKIPLIAKWYTDSVEAIQERSVLLGIQHAHITPLRDYATVDADQELNIFDWVPSSLDRELSTGPLTYGTTIAIVQQISNALFYLHTMGFVHCDVKPGNILFDDVTQNSFLSDWGAARRYTDRLEGLSWNAIGTFRYCAPEQRRKEPVTPATDQFSFALVVAEMLRGQAFFASLFIEDRDELDYLKLEHIFDGTRYEQTFQKALGIDRTKRFKSILDFADEIQRLISTEMRDNSYNGFNGESRHRGERDDNPKPSSESAQTSIYDETRPFESSSSSILGSGTSGLIFTYHKVAETERLHAASPDELISFRMKLLEQVEEYLDRIVFLLIYKSSVQQDCMERLQKAKMKLIELSDHSVPASNVDSYRRSIMEIMYEIRLIHVIMTREQKSQEGEKLWRWIVPLLVLSYIAAIILSIVYGRNYYTSGMDVPLLGVPVSVILWASVGSLGAILYRFYTQEPGKLADEVRWLVARPIIGIIMGMLGYLTVLSGMFAFGGESAMDATLDARPQLMWLLAFLGGFSDRFFESVINGVIGKFSNDSK